MARTWDAGRWSSPRRTRPRVLVESSDAAVGWALGNALERAGYEVAVCHGPSVHGAPCPLVQKGECELAAGADVIVNRMWLTEPANRDVLRALPTYVPATPVIVEARLPERDRHADVLAGCRVVPAPLGIRGLLGVVRGEGTGTGAAMARDRENGRTETWAPRSPPRQEVARITVARRRRTGPPPAGHR